jgi:hypothetical protein
VEGIRKAWLCVDLIRLDRAAYLYANERFGEIGDAILSDSIAAAWRGGYCRSEDDNITLEGVRCRIESARAEIKRRIGYAIQPLHVFQLEV